MRPIARWAPSLRVGREFDWRMGFLSIGSLSIVSLCRVERR